MEMAEESHSWTVLDHLQRLDRADGRLRPHFPISTGLAAKCRGDQREVP